MYLCPSFVCLCMCVLCMLSLDSRCPEFSELSLIVVPSNTIFATLC